MNFCPKCYGELTGNPGPRFQGYCPKCKQNVVMKSDAGPLTAKMNVFLGVSLSNQIDALQKTANELLAEVKKLAGKEAVR